MHLKRPFLSLLYLCMFPDPERMTRLKIPETLCNRWEAFHRVLENSTPKYYLCRKRELVAHVTDKPKDYWLQIQLDPSVLNNAVSSAFLLWVPFLEVLSSLWQDDCKLFWSSRKKESCFLEVLAKVLRFDLIGQCTSCDWVDPVS